MIWNWVVLAIILVAMGIMFVRFQRKLSDFETVAKDTTATNRELLDLLTEFREAPVLPAEPEVDPVDKYRSLADERAHDIVRAHGGAT